MKLTKGKISKLYNKKHQSHRRNKKMPKNKRSFRKRRALNLASKSLKMHAGFIKSTGRTKQVTSILKGAPGLIAYYGKKYLSDKVKQSFYNKKYPGFTLFNLSFKTALLQSKSAQAPQAIQSNPFLNSLEETRVKYEDTEEKNITIDTILEFYKKYKQIVDEKLATCNYKEISELNKILETPDVVNSPKFPLFANDVKYITEQYYKKVFGPKVDTQKLDNLSDGQKDELFEKVTSDANQNNVELSKINDNGQISKQEYEEEMDKIGKPEGSVSFELPVFLKEIYDMDRNSRGLEMRNRSVAQHEQQQVIEEDKRNALNNTLSEAFKPDATDEQIQSAINVVQDEIQENDNYIQENSSLNDDLLKESVELNKLLTITESDETKEPDETNADKLLNEWIKLTNDKWKQLDAEMKDKIQAKINEMESNRGITGRTMELRKAVFEKESKELYNAIKLDFDEKTNHLIDEHLVNNDVSTVPDDIKEELKKINIDLFNKALESVYKYANEEVYDESYADFSEVEKNYIKEITSDVWIYKKDTLSMLERIYTYLRDNRPQNILVKLYRWLIRDKTLKTDLFKGLRNNKEKYDEIMSNLTSKITVFSDNEEFSLDYVSRLEDVGVRLKKINEGTITILHKLLKNNYPSIDDINTMLENIKHDRIPNVIPIESDNNDPNHKSLVFNDWVGGAAAKPYVSYDEYFKYINDHAKQMKSYEEINDLKLILTDKKTELTDSKLYSKLMFDVKNLENAFYRTNLGKLMTDQRTYINNLDYDTKEFFFYYVIQWFDDISERVAFLDKLFTNANSTITSVVKEMNEKQRQVGDKSFENLTAKIDKTIEYANKALLQNPEPIANEPTSESTFDNSGANNEVLNENQTIIESTEGATTSESTFDKSGANNGVLDENQSVVETTEGRQVREMLNQMVIGLANEIGKVIERPEIVETDPKYFTDAVDAILKTTNPNQAPDTNSIFSSNVVQQFLNNKSGFNPAVNNDQIKELEQKIDALTKTVQELNPKFKEEKDDLMELIQQLKDELEKKKSDASIGTEQVTEQGTEQGTEEKGTDAANFEEITDTEKQKIDELTKQLTEKDAEILSLQQELELLKQQTPLNEEKIQELGRNLNTMEQEKVKLNEEIEQLKNANKSDKEAESIRITELENELNQKLTSKEEQLQLLMAKLNELEKKSPEDQARIQELERNLDTITSEKANLEEQMKENEDEKRRQAEIIAQLNEERENERNEFEQQKNNLGLTTSELERLKAEHDEREKVLNEKIEQQKQQHEANLSKFKSALDETQKKYDEQLDKLQSKSTPINQLRELFEKISKDGFANINMFEANRNITTQIQNMNSIQDYEKSELRDILNIQLPEEYTGTNRENYTQLLTNIKNLKDALKTPEQKKAEEEAEEKAKQEAAAKEEAARQEAAAKEEAARQEAAAKESERLQAEEKVKQEAAAKDAEEKEKNSLTYEDIINSISKSQFDGAENEPIDDITDDTKMFTKANQVTKYNNYLGINRDDPKSSLSDTMKSFLSLINSVIYDSQVNLMLNSLNYENYKALSTQAGVKEYISSFIDFIFIDISQLSQYVGSDTIKITKGEKTYDIPKVKFEGQIQNIISIYDDLKNILILRKVVNEEGNTNIQPRINFYNVIVDPDIKYSNSQNNLIHILELCSFIKTYADQPKQILEKTNDDVTKLLYAFMDGRISKLKSLIDKFNAINASAKLNFFTGEKSLLLSYIITQNQKYILSYLKLNNFGQIDKYNNKRFGITTDENANYINIKYNTDNTEYKITSGGDWAEGESDPKYKDNNIYGRFDKIYKLKSKTGGKTTNQEIAKNMVELLRNILLGKLLFIIGYGASGSGKTSTLIYLNDTKNNVKEDGILIHLCKLLGRGGKFEVTENNKPISVEFASYNKLTVYTKEFFVSNIEAIGNCDAVDNAQNCETQELNFNYDKDKEKFVIESESPLPIKFKYKTDNTEFELKSKTLGEVLIHLIDTDRFVKSTTNNISSSRSHSLIYVVMTREGSPVGDSKNQIQFVIGDLAGVENTFNCEDKSVLKTLMNIGSKTTNGNLESNYVPLNPSTNNVEPNFDYDLDTVNMVLDNNGFTIEPIKMKTLDDLKTLVKEYNINIQDLMAPSKSKNIISGIPGKPEITGIYKEITKNLVNNDTKTDEFKEIIRQMKPLYIDKSKLTVGSKLPNEKAHMWYYDNIPIHKQIYAQSFTPILWKEPFETLIAETKKLTDYLSNADRFGLNLIEPQQLIPNSILSKKGGTKSRKNKLKNKRQTRRVKQSGGGNVSEKTFNLSLMQKVRDYAQSICKSRVVEGKYINKSLAELRNHITRIMIHKTKDCIFYSPPFHSECFQYYCPTGANCFSLESNDSKNSVLIDWIYEQYNKTNKSDINKFYDDIIVSMFCVMNLSRTANNPPPIPYINIKKMKQKWAICVNTIYGSDEEFTKGDYVLLQKILEELDTLLGIYDKKTQVSEIVAQRGKMTITSKIIGSKGKIEGVYKTEFDKLIEIIDSHNAVTAMGTVDYADSFNKLNTPVTNCMTEVEVVFGNDLTKPQVL